MSPSAPVSSYLTFSPLPAPEGAGGYFLSRYSAVIYSDSYPLGNMALYVARTFLTPNRAARDGRPGGPVKLLLHVQSIAAGKDYATLRGLA